MAKEFSVKGLNAVITGSSRGVGRAIAEIFAAEGANVCVAARSEIALTDVAKALKEKGSQFLALAVDVSDMESVDRFAETVLDQLGSVDILVNNAGIALVKPMVPIIGSKHSAKLESISKTKYTNEEWTQVIDTNLKGPFLCMRAFGPQMMERRKGKVINISSVNSVKAGKYRFSYDVSKGGLSQLTRSMAVEWGRFNVNVNAIGAGYVHTRMTHELMTDDRLRSRALKEIPLGRFATTRDIALLALYLGSSASDFVTGQTIFVDGGATA